jgi:hypothetical protein
MSQDDVTPKVPLTKVERDILAQITTSSGSALEINQQGNKLLLFFVGSLGCPFCNGTMEDIYTLHDTLIKLHIVPVIVHHETDEEYEKFISTDERTEKYRDILHCSRTKDVNMAFKLKSTDFLGKMMEILQGAISELSRLGEMGISVNSVKQFASPETKSLLAAVFVVNQGEVVCEYRKERKYQRFDLTKLALDPDGFGIDSEVNVLDEQPIQFKKVSNHEKAPEERTLTRKASSFKSSIKDVRIALKDVMASQHYRGYFKLFCATEFSPENVLFWECVQVFSKKTKEKDLEKHAKQIWNVFFDSGSGLEVNIDSTTRKQMEDVIQKPHRDMFEDVADKILGSSIADQYCRFVVSPYYKEMQEKKTPGKFLLVK